jgi:hypothetical protein
MDMTFPPIRDEPTPINPADRDSLHRHDDFGAGRPVREGGGYDA